MKHFLTISLMLFLSGCVTGEMVSDIEPGMSTDQVESILGKPDGFQQRGEYTVYKYANRLISGWSWDKADYSFVFKDDKLIEYGPGEVRERDVGGVHSVFIYQL